MNELDEKTRTYRDRVEAFQEAIQKEQPVDMPVDHFFADGVYGRVMSACAGTTAVGKIHRYADLNILLKGDVSVFTEDGVVRIQAPAVFVGKAGDKRIAYFHEDTEWMTVHATQSTEPEEIVKEVTAENFNDLVLLANMQRAIGRDS